MIDWIETKDRLPKIGSKCVLCASKNIILGEFVSVNPVGFKVYELFVLNEEIVTHWAELPEPPENV